MQFEQKVFNWGDDIAGWLAERPGRVERWTKLERAVPPHNKVKVLVVVMYEPSTYVTVNVPELAEIDEPVVLSRAEA